MNKDTEKKIAELLRRLEQPLAAIMATELEVIAICTGLMEMQRQESIAFNKRPYEEQESEASRQQLATIGSLEDCTDMLWELRATFEHIENSPFGVLKTLMNYEEQKP